MKQVSIIFLSILSVLLACNEVSHQTESTEESEVSLPVACYAMFTNKDSIIMQFEVNENVVIGSLTYNFFEKDDNSGSIKGKLKGDTIFANYTFKSEGVTSEREVAFLKVGNTYVEGYGELMERKGKMVFKEETALDFESGTILTEIGCLK